jgi:hypothetical protein
VRLWLNIAVKAALVALLLFGTLSGAERFEGKAMLGRLLTYPLAALVVPVAWWLRGRRGAYPHAIDILLVLPFLIDTIGNALDLYDSISWWDDANHLVNWAILTAAFAQLLLRLRVPPLELAALATGFGAFTAIVWEIGEYFAFIRDSPEFATAYTDTLGDLTLGTTGSLLAATATALVRRRQGVG